MIKFKQKSLRGALLAAMGATAMAGFSSQANAGLTFSSLGTYTGSTLTLDSSSPYKAFTDYQAKNQGWTHTARFLGLTVGTASDIANGTTFDVQLTMTGRGALTATGTINNPAFAVWAAGSNSLTPGNTGGQHGWNPTRGPNDNTNAINTLGNLDTLTTNANWLNVGVLDGHQGWVGYVNAGPNYVLDNFIDPGNSSAQTGSGQHVYDNVSHGAVNTTSLTILTNPGASSTGYSDNFYRSAPSGAFVGSAPDFATMILYGLKAGNYLIGTGGSCPGYATNALASAACGTGGLYTFSVSSAPALAAVPVPSALWLFGSAMAGLVGFKRRK